jgi:hypothetical protein
MTSRERPACFGCSWEYADTPASGKAARHAVAAEVNPGDRQGCSRSEKALKYLIMREQVFGIGDDHWVTFRKYFLDSQLTLSPLSKAIASPLFTLRA